MVGIPFNALKDAIVVIVTVLLYKRLRNLFKKIDAQKN
jgi:riboflavin transporter FmnP